MPVGAEENLRRYAREWRERGVRAWAEGWWDTSMTLGDQLGRIIGAPPGSTVMHQNVAVAQAIVLSCFEFEPPRNRIVYGEGEFPSVRYLYQAQRRRGAVVALDAYQSVGSVPLDVSRLGVDFVVGGSVKWLCGGPGAGWLYVRPELAEGLEPTFTGWQAHARPFAFEPEHDYAAGAARFLTGTPNVPALYAASAGYELVEEVGVERIREHSMRQTALLVELLERAGLEVVSPRDPARRGGTVVVRTPEPEAVHRELDAREIVCDFRPGVGIRLGPHFFNTDEEVRFAAAQIAEIVESGAYRLAE